MKTLFNFFKKLFSWSTNNHFYYVNEEVRFEESRLAHQVKIVHHQNKAS